MSLRVVKRLRHLFSIISSGVYKNLKTSGSLGFVQSEVKVFR